MSCATKELLATALYRNGRIEEAHAAFIEADELVESGSQPRTPQMQLFRSMVEWKLGDEQSARQRYRQAKAALEANPPTWKGDRELDECLLQEVEQLLEINVDEPVVDQPPPATTLVK